MRNRIAITPPPDVSTGHPEKTGKSAVLKGVRKILNRGVDWLRAGYPDGAPRTGHSPLLALCGPMALTSDQQDRISQDLKGQNPSTIDIDIAITKVTGRLPTPTQTLAASRALRHRASRQ